MQRWMVMLCLVGCAEGAGMRPRGLRNSVRIESLERRIAKTEVKLGIEPERPPPMPRSDLQRTELDQRMDTIDARMRALDDRLASIDERISTLYRMQTELQKQLAELRLAPAAPPAAP